MTDTRRVVALDLALVRTGIATLTLTLDAGHVTATVERLTLRRPVPAEKRPRLGLPEHPTLVERRDCLDDALEQIGHRTAHADLLAIYDIPERGKVAGAARVDIPSLWNDVVGDAIHNGIPVARVLDVSARKALTGSGKSMGREADKVATALAVARLWPDVVTDGVSDDETDALGLAHLAAVALDWPVTTLARHRDVKWSEWPRDAPLLDVPEVDEPAV